MAVVDAPERWVLVKPLPKSGFTADERGSDLVKKMVEAKIGGADKIFIDDVFDEDCGLLAPGGSPSPLFLPWRTTAMALQGAEFIGSLDLPEGSRNFAFSRKGDVAIVVWNHEPVDEDLYLSDESIVTDVLGRRIRLPTNAAGLRQKIRIGPSPLVIRHFPEQIARWMAAVSFEKGRLPSKTGKQREVIHGVNTFHQGVSGQVRIIVPKDWKVEPPEARFSLAAGEKFDIPITLELPSNTSLGSQRIVLDFALSPYAFRVYREYEVGLGDVDLLGRRFADSTTAICRSSSSSSTTRSRKSVSTSSATSTSPIANGCNESSPSSATDATPRSTRCPTPIRFADKSCNFGPSRSAVSES